MWREVCHFASISSHVFTFHFLESLNILLRISHSFEFSLPFPNSLQDSAIGQGIMSKSAVPEFLAIHAFHNLRYSADMVGVRVGSANEF